jgi:transcriptional regulator with XRE-family HTH domain
MLPLDLLPVKAVNAADKQFYARLQIMLTTGAQIRMARAALRMEQEELARQANLSVETVRRLEKRSGPIEDARIGTLRDLTAAFAKLGVTFGDGDRPSVAIDAARLGR